MYRRLLCLLLAVLLLTAGCAPADNSLPETTDFFVPARTLLVVLTDRTGAQNFLLFRLSAQGDVAVVSCPRETVFSRANPMLSTLYESFADGGATATKNTLRLLAENGHPVDRILSVDVETADSGFHALLSSLGNNLLFTNPPDFVYTIGVEKSGTSATVSETTLRRLLCLPLSAFSQPQDYSQLRLLAATAVLREMSAAFASDPTAAFSVLTRAGKSSFLPADCAVFSALFSPTASVRCAVLRGTFVGEGARLRFYPDEV